jgi:hypothetical protein
MLRVSLGEKREVREAVVQRAICKLGEKLDEASDREGPGLVQRIKYELVFPVEGLKQLVHHGGGSDLGFVPSTVSLEQAVNVFGEHVCVTVSKLQRDVNVSCRSDLRIQRLNGSYKLI